MRQRKPKNLENSEIFMGIARNHAAILDKPRAIWTHHLSRGIVCHGDQPQRFLLLSCLHSASFCSDSRSVCTHRNPPQSTTYFPKLPAPDRLLGPTNTLADIFYQSAQPNPATNKSRIPHAKPIAPPRPPRQRLRTNPPIASAPAGHSRVHAATRRRRTCDRSLRFFAN
jgi:hypothetical protein